MKRKLLLLLSLIVFSNFYAQIDFISHDIIDDSLHLDEPWSVFAVDIDGDGDLDVLSASAGDNKIAWNENIDGLGSFGILKTITTDAVSARSVYAIDLDGDGDIDVLSASADDDKIAWYENINGLGSFGSQQIISTNATHAHSVFASDLDGDGDMDVLSASEHDNKIAWYENIDGQGNFGVQQNISTNALGAHQVYSTDIDGDGDMDVLSASIHDNKIAWYENTDGLGSFGSQQIISTNASAAYSLFATDIDGDGDMDVLSASILDDKIAWYENTDELGSFGSQQIISTNIDRPIFVIAADLDGDGDMDVLSSSNDDNQIAWFENIDGQGTFMLQQTISTSLGGYSVYAADLDNDGNIDVLSASNDNAWWFKNTDGQGTFGMFNKITISVVYPVSIFSADLDGDGDLDLLSASKADNLIAWYENTDGLGTYGIQQIITTNADLAHSVLATDIDGDGDMDVIFATESGKLAWHENIDGQGNFGFQQLITTASYSGIVHVDDMDGDGDMDVLSTFEGGVAWYENTNGQGSFGAAQIISTNINNVSSIYSSDIDGDGGTDVLSASIDDDKIAWYENIDGLGNFGTQQIISFEIRAASVYASDLDGDGDMDVITGADEDGNGDRLAWHENTNGQGSFVRQAISTTSISHVRSIFASDIDGDGDIDILAAYDISVGWVENIDGQGTFGFENDIAFVGGVESVHAGDIDGDGDMDMISAGSFYNEIFWHENVDFLSVNENQLLDFTVYPIPTTEILKVSSEETIAQLEIFNQLGQLVLSNLNQNSIDLSELNNGVYFIKIKDGNGNIDVKKTIKK